MNTKQTGIPVASFNSQAMNDLAKSIIAENERKASSVTDSGKAPSVTRDQLIAELLEAVLDLRKAWIAPHRFSEQKASLNVARLSDAIQQLEA